MSKNPYQKYKQTAVQSASKEKLLLMLYEGAIKFMKLSIASIEQKKVADKGINIGRAYEIILELNNTLDNNVGGYISKNLEQFYLYITEQLTTANINNDVKALKNALKVTETLYEGWQKAIEQLKNSEKGA